MSYQRARETIYQFPPFPSLPRSGQRDKKAKRHRSPTKSAKHTGELRFLDEFATRGIFLTFFSRGFGVLPLSGLYKWKASCQYYIMLYILACPCPDPSDTCSRTSLILQLDIHTPVRSSTGILARLEPPLDVPFRLFLLSSLRSASHSAQPVCALVVGVQVAAVALFAGNRRLVLAA